MGEKKTGRKSLTLTLYAIFMLVVLIIATTTPPAAAGGSSPSDVSSNDPNSMYINYLVKQNIMSGYPDGSFHPAEGLTRAQAAVVMVRATGLSPVELGGRMFPDVAQEHWAAGYIARCVQAGYLKGYPDGSFKPEAKLSRAQGISLVLRLSKQDMSKAELPTLADVSSEYWAAPQIATGLAAGMIGLSSDQQHYLPEQAISREELSRALATLLTSDPEQYKRPLIGKISVEGGTIELTRAGKTQRLSKETEIQTKDIIESQTGSTAVINYPDGSSVLIKENTRIEIKDSQGRAYIKKDGSPGVAVDYLNIDIRSGRIFTALATPGAKVEEKKAGIETLLASLGTLSYIAAAESIPPWYQSAQQKKVKVKVDMPYGVAAIRGTFISISVAPSGQCSVSCLTGSATISSQSGSSVNLGGGQSSGLQQQGTPPAPPAPMNEQQQQEFQQAREWVEQTAQQIDQNQSPPPPPPPVAEQPEQQQQQPVQQQQPAQQQQQPSQTLENVQNALGGSSSPGTPNNGNTPGTSVTPGTPSGGGSGGGGSGGSSDDSSPRIQSIENISGSVIAGQSYTPPGTVTAMMSNDTSRQVAVSWENNNPDTSTAGVISINGSVAGYSGTVILTLTIEPPIARIDDLSASVVEGDPYELPPVVNAILSDGSTRQTAVNWDTSNFDTSQPGVVTVNGTVEGYSGTVKLIITVERKTGAPVSIVTCQPLNLAGGIKIDLGSLAVPEGATVTVNEISPPDTGSAGLEAAGKVIDITFENLDISQPVSLTLPVNPGVDPSQAGIYYYNGSGWEYQPSEVANGAVTAMVSHFSIYGVLMDNTPPSQPTLSKGNSSAQGVELNFTATDNSAVVKYEIYRNEELIATVEAQSYLDTTVEGRQSYSYQVKAIDKGGNESELSEVLEVEILSDKKEILSFSLAEQTGEAVIDSENHSIEIEVKKEAVVTNLIPAITISEGASIEPVAGTPRDFTSPVVYTVTAADGSSQEWTVAVSKAKSSEARLQGISIEGTTLDPIFDSEIYSYTATVSKSTDKVTISCIPMDAGAVVEINGAEGSSSQLSLNPGENLINIEVTSEDESASKTYTININREEKSDNAYLSALSISTGSLSPAFDKEQSSYSSSVPYNIGTVNVAATPEDPLAIVSINGTVGNSSNVNLNEGANSIGIRVVAEDGSSSRDYNIAVNRDAAPPPPPPPPPSINIYGPAGGSLTSSINIPTDPSWTDLQLTVKDQNGNILPDGSVTWSIEEQESLDTSVHIGNEIEPENDKDLYGLLTVYSDASPGLITIKAVSGSGLEDTAQITLYRSWQTLGTPGFSGALLEDSDIGLAFDDEQVYTAYTDNVGEVVMAYIYEGDWSSCSPDSNYPGKGPLDLKCFGDPLLAWWDGNDAIAIRAGHYDEGWQWNPYPSGLDPLECDEVSAVSITLDDNDAPLLAYQAGSDVRVLQALYEESWYWEGQVFTGASNPKLAVDYYYCQTLPYLAYQSGSNVVLKRFASGSWSQLGAISGASSPSLDCLYGIPYLAYQSGSDVMLKKFASGSWSQVGTTISNASQPHLCMAPDGIPYLAFRDGSQGGKATVLKGEFDADNGIYSWVNLGSPGFTPGTADEPKLCVQDSMVGLAFKDGSPQGNGGVTAMGYEDSRPLAGVYFDYCPGEWAWLYGGDTSMKYSVNGAGEENFATASGALDLMDNLDAVSQYGIIVRLQADPGEAIYLQPYIEAPELSEGDEDDNYSPPEPGSASGSTKIEYLSLPAGASKWRVKVLDSPAFSYPLNGIVSGASDYTAGSNIATTAGQYLLLLATDADNRTKAFAEIPIGTGQIATGVILVMSEVTPGLLGTIYEVNKLTVTHGAVINGRIGLRFDDGSPQVDREIAVTSGETVAQIAEKVYDAFAEYIDGYTIDYPSGNYVTFTSYTAEADKDVQMTIYALEPSVCTWIRTINDPDFTLYLDVEVERLEVDLSSSVSELINHIASYDGSRQTYRVLAEDGTPKSDAAILNEGDSLEVTAEDGSTRHYYAIEGAC